MLEDNRILQSEIDGMKVGSVQGNRLVGTVQENKNVFDRLALLIVGKFNALVDLAASFVTKDYVDEKLNDVVAGDIDLSGYIKVNIYKNVVVPVSSWVQNTCMDFDEQERQDYPYMSEVPLKDVRATDIGDALPEYAIERSNFLGNYSTADGRFIVESTEIPEMDIKLDWIKISRRI